MVQIFRQPLNKKKSSNNHAFDIEIEGLDHLGRGVGRFQGKVCFVTNALPKEHVKALTKEDKSQFIQADSVKILRESPDRVKPECPWFTKCGGCQLQHLSNTAQILEKQNRVNQLFEKYKMTDLPWQPAIQGQPFKYRNRTRLAAWYEGKKDKLRVGFRAFNSKDIIEIDQCLVIAPEFSRIIPELVQCLNQLDAKKQITHIEFNSVAQRKAIVLKVMRDLPDKDKISVAEFAYKHNFYLELLKDKAESEVLEGDENELYYQINDLSLGFGLNDFVQVNSEMNLAMIEQALTWLDLKQTDQVLDLFSGLGNFSLPMAQKVQKVVGIEGMQEMVDKAVLNADFNLMDNVEFYQQDLNASQLTCGYNWSNFNKIILDPARQGAELVCQNSHLWNADAVLYIACEPSALVRDCQHLLDNGYKLVRIGLVDMFPQTAHVETMALFCR